MCKGIMKKISLILLLAVCMLAGCGRSVEQQIAEQLALGQKYLEELDYEQAIVAFNQVIELDPKAIKAYTGLMLAYEGIDQSEQISMAVEAALAELSEVEDREIQLEFLTTAESICAAREDWEHWRSIMELLINLEPENTEYQQRLAEYDEQVKEERIRQEQDNIRKTITENLVSLEIPLTADEIELGVTNIETAKNVYAGRPYVKSNLMNDDTVDTVYTVYNEYGMPMPEGYGYSENSFGFLFSAPVTTGVIDTIIIQDDSFECLGALHVGDDWSKALELFKIPYVDLKNGDIECTSGTKKIEYAFQDDIYVINYTINSAHVKVSGTEDGKIRGIDIWLW